MIFDQKPLREITEADLRAEIAAGLAEHLFLDYKLENYGQRDADRKEFLLDICQFANAEGGFLLLGVPEVREEGRPTGVPDPDGQLGIEIENPENALLRYDALIAANIHERLRVESCSIPIQGGRVVLAFRVPNSTAKPHCVKLQGEHVYFPIRRERHRVYLDIREVKEMAMRTASQLERARSVLEASLPNEPRPGTNVCFHIGLVPVFFREFLVDVKLPRVREAFAAFHVRTGLANLSQPTFSYEGLVRATQNRDWVTLCRIGLIKSTSIITAREHEGRLYCFPVSADLLLRNFVVRAQTFTQVAEIVGPYLLKVALHSPSGVVALGAGLAGGEEEIGQLGAGYWPSPEMQLDTISDPFSQIIRPFCDFLHQMFGCEESPNFDADGNWVGRA